MKAVKLNSKRSVLTFIGLLTLITLEAQSSNAQPQCDGIFSSIGSHRKSGPSVADSFPTEEVKVKTRNEYSDNLQRLESVLATEVAKGGWLRNSLSYYKDIAASIEGQVISGIQLGNDLQTLRLFAGRVVSAKPANGINYNDGYEAVIEGPFGRQTISTNNGLIQNLHIARSESKRIKTGNERIDSIPAEEVKVYSHDDYSKESKRLESVLTAQVEKGGWKRNTNRYYKDIAESIKGKVIAGTRLGHDLQTVLLFAGRVVLVKPENGVDYSDGYDVIIEGPLGFQTISSRGGYINNLYIAE